MRAGEAGQSRSSAITMIVLVIVAAILYVARDVFIPLALAMLLSFLLAPFLGFLVRHKIPRIPAVLVVVITTFMVLGGLGYLVTTQVYDLAKKLPEYQDTVKAKLHSLRPPGGGLLERANHFFKETSKELEARPTDTQPGHVAPADEQKPLPVEVHSPKPNTLQILKNFLGPALHPLSIAGIVIIFVIFMLLEKETLLDRFIRLAGTGQLQNTTQALNDAGARVSRYLLMQLIVNVTYGLPIGIGLYFIGVPNPLLWGLMATVLRFIPYVGPWLAAAIPLLLAFAVDPGWSMLCWTVAVYVGVELISNNAIEPWLYGSSTGLSSLAILVSAVFWTWLWGPVGLLLSTPLTVCLVVLGRYFPQLEFLSVLLGDEPVLSEDARFYQRLLAMDQEEAENLAEKNLKEHSLCETFDNMIVPALALAEYDKHRGSMPENRQTFIIESTAEIARNLTETAEELNPGTRPKNHDQPDEARIICLPAKDEADELSGMMLAMLLDNKGIPARALSAKTLLNEYLDEMEAKQATIVCVSCVPPSGLRHARYVCKRLRSRFPQIKLILGVWSSQEPLEQIKERLKPVQMDAIVFRMKEALEQIVALMTVTESLHSARVPEQVAT